MSSYFDEFEGGDNNDKSDSESESSNDTEEELEEEEEHVDVGDIDPEILEGGDEEEEEDEEEEDEEQEGGDGPEDLEEGEIDEEAEETNKKSKKIKKIPSKTIYKKPELDDDEDEDDDDEDGEMYLQKFDQSINDNYVVNFHPESVLQNYDEILNMVKVFRDNDGIIIDDLHKTIPYLTKYERTRILGQRAKQINSGATPFIKVPENVIDGYIIAELELKEKKIPFIIRRPLPNGGSEYWSIQDLEDISF